MPSQAPSILLFVASLAFSACVHAEGSRQPASESTIVKLASSPGGDIVLMHGPAGKVTLDEVKAAVQVLIPVSQRETFFESPRNIEQLALSIYTRQALAAEAAQKGFDKNPDIARAGEIARTQAIADLWLLKKSKEAEPTPEQLEKYARSIFDGQGPKKQEDGKPVEFESQRVALMQQARAKLVNQARAEAWQAAQAGAESVPEAIAGQVTAPAEK